MFEIKLWLDDAYSENAKILDQQLIGFTILNYLPAAEFKSFSDSDDKSKIDGVAGKTGSGWVMINNIDDKDYMFIENGVVGRYKKNRSGSNILIEAKLDEKT